MLKKFKEILKDKKYGIRESIEQQVLAWQENYPCILDEQFEEIIDLVCADKDYQTTSEILYHQNFQNIKEECSENDTDNQNADAVNKVIQQYIANINKETPDELQKIS